MSESTRHMIARHRLAAYTDQELRRPVWPYILASAVAGAAVLFLAHGIGLVFLVLGSHG